MSLLLLSSWQHEQVRLRSEAYRTKCCVMKSIAGVRHERWKSGA